MAKKNARDADREQAAEPASKQKPVVEFNKRYEQSICIQQPQRVSLLMWVLATVAGVVAQLRRGRPPYERAPITAVVEEALAGGVDPTLDHLVGRVRSLLELRGIPAPGDTVLTEICKPVFLRAKSAGQ
jgi:hypothetical protein